MESISAALGIPLGKFIPLAVYDAVSALAWKALPDDIHKQLFAVGWNGLGYRARSASDHEDAFRSLFASEPAASHTERFEQDRAFFGFVTNAASAGENLVYAVYAAALGLSGAKPTKEHLWAKWSQMVEAVKAVAATRALGEHIDQQMKKAQAQSLFLMRDVVLHRGRMPKNHFVGGQYDGKATLAANPKSLPPDWENTFVFDAECITPWAMWLGEHIEESSKLLRAALAA